MARLLSISAQKLMKGVHGIDRRILGSGLKIDKQKRQEAVETSWRSNISFDIEIHNTVLIYTLVRFLGWKAVL